MVQVKICGVTRLADALAATEAGADMIGLNFYSGSPRYITPESATALCAALRDAAGADTPRLIGVFVNEPVSRISAIMTQVGLSGAQLHGDESRDMLKELRGTAFKAIQPPDVDAALDDVAYYAPSFPPESAGLPAVLVDAYHPRLRGGTGETISAEIGLAVREHVPRYMLAGGLNAENVAERVRGLRPWGVDTASGVESGTAGVKDHEKVWAFVLAAKQAAED